MGGPPSLLSAWTAMNVSVDSFHRRRRYLLTFHIEAVNLHLKGKRRGGFRALPVDPHQQSHTPGAGGFAKRLRLTHLHLPIHVG